MRSVATNSENARSKSSPRSRPSSGAITALNAAVSSPWSTLTTPPTGAIVPTRVAMNAP